MASRGNIQSRQQSVCVKMRLNRPRARVTSAYFGTSGTNPVGKFARNCPCFLIITYLAFVARYSNCHEMRIRSLSCLYSWALALDRASGLWNRFTETCASHDREYKSGWHGVDMAACGGCGKMILLQLVINLVLKRNQQKVAFLGSVFSFHKCSEKEF